MGDVHGGLQFVRGNMYWKWTRKGNSYSDENYLVELKPLGASRCEARPDPLAPGLLKKPGQLSVGSTH